VTRAIINAIQDNKIDLDNLNYLEKLNLHIPRELDGVETNCLNPRSSWESDKAYDQECEALCQRFKDNFNRFDVPQEIIDAGPK
jgi:phosphoenolpyruvate carboxykinase (ATP)